MAAGIGLFTACEDVPAPYNIPSESPTPVVPTADYILSQSFTSTLGEFKTVSESGSLAWEANSKYGAVITGYQDFDGSGTKSNQPGVTYLYSPEIDLSEADSAYIVIEQAINYAKETLAEDHHLLIRVAEGEWQELPMSLDGLGNSFSYITQNIQIPQEYMGQKIQLALKHIAHETYSSTWEVKSLKVAKGQAPAASGDTPVEGLVGSGTKDDPYDVPSTIKLIAAGPPSTKIYTKGIVSQIDEIDTGSYGNATYFISNDGSSKDQLEVYRGYGLGGEKFKSQDDLKVGDEVIVYGQVVYYNNKTMEFTQGSQLYMHNGQTAGGGGDTPVEGIEVTCAEAVELTNALDDGASSSEVYTVTGYITEVVGGVSKDQQTFWMADAKNGGRVFEAYYANLPSGVSEFKIGSKVKITGKLMKYVNKNNGQVIPEIKNANVEILEEGGDTPAPTGIEVTCAKAVELTNALADGASSEDNYSVTGFITEIVSSVSRNQQSFWMADTQDGGKVFEAYWANLPNGVSEFNVGSKVKITGKLMKYVKDGNVTPEIKNATVEILDGGGSVTNDGIPLAEFNNGGFETWNDTIPAYWQSSTTASTKNTVYKSTDAHSGQYSVQIVGSSSSNNRLASTELALEAGEYTISFYVKPEADGGSVRPGYVPVKDGNVGSYVYGDYTNDLPAGEWTKITHTFSLSAATTVNLLVMNPKKPGRNILVDDFSIVKN